MASNENALENVVSATRIPFKSTVLVVQYIISIHHLLLHKHQIVLGAPGNLQSINIFYLYILPTTTVTKTLQQNGVAGKL